MAVDLAPTTRASTAEPAVDGAALGRRRGVPRWHIVALIVIAGIGLVRGCFWAATTEMWNPIDETAHFGYVESIATGHGIPEVGRDLVSVEVLGVAKTSPTYYSFRVRPYTVSTADRNWGGTAAQYEAVQGPVYYALLAPAYWLGRPFGFLPAVYAVRAGSVLLALLAIPLAWLLARELFPRHPAVWLLTPLFLVMVNGFNANVASVSNDALVITGTLAATLAFLRVRTTRSTTSAVVAGFLVALCVVNKTTSLALVPFLGVLFVATLVQSRSHWRQLMRWAIAFTIAAAVTVAPWIAFNLATYGGISASKQVSKITGSSQVSVPLSAAGLKTQAEGAQQGFWELQPRSLGRAVYADALDAMVLGALVVGVCVALVRGRRDDAGNLAWLALAFPSAFLAMMVIVYGVFGGGGVAIGRHYYMALVPVVLAIVAGVITALGARVGVVVVLILIAIAAGREQRVVDHYVQDTYLHGMIDGQPPAVEQTWVDRDVLQAGVVLRPPCPARYFSIDFEGDAPATVALAGGGSARAASLVASDGNFGTYVADAPITSPTTVTFPAPTVVRAADGDRTPAASFSDGSEEPALRIFCPRSNAEAVRFGQVYGPQHPGFITWTLVRWWPRAWMALAWAAAAIGAILAVASTIGPRRSAAAGQAVAEPRA